MGNNFINILSHQKSDKYLYGFITEEFLISTVNDFNEKFYSCGPPPMMDALENIFQDLNIPSEQIVKEEF